MTTDDNATRKQTVKFTRCPTCRGSGKTLETVNGSFRSTRCEDCNGTGRESSGN